MEQTLASEASVSAKASRDWVKLIRKLRWIGLDDEARSLEAALRTLPPEERSSVVFGPVNTD